MHTRTHVCMHTHIIYIRAVMYIVCLLLVVIMLVYVDKYAHTLYMYNGRVSELA